MTLYSLFKQHSLQLPSVTERKKLYSGYKLGEDYVGSAEQNINLSKAIEKDARAFDSFVKGLKTPEPKVVLPKEVKDIFKEEPVEKKAETFEIRTLTVGKTVGDWLKENKIEFEDFQKLNPAYKTPDFKVESPFKVRVAKPTKFLKDYPELIKRTVTSVAPIETLKETSELEKLIKQTIPNLLKEGIRKIPRILIGDKDILPEITSEIAKGIKQTQEYYKQKNIEKELADKSKAKSIRWDVKSILKSFILMTQPLAIYERRSEEKKIMKQKEELRALIPSLKDVISLEAKIELSHEERLEIFKPKQKNESPETAAARLRREYQVLQSRIEDLRLKDILIGTRGDDIGLENTDGSYESFFALNQDVEELEKEKERVEVLSKKMGGAIAEYQVNADKSLEWQAKMFENLEERTGALYSIITDPRYIKDTSVLAKIFSIFPSRATLMLGVTASPNEALIQTPETKELIAEMEGLLTERMKEIIEKASVIETGDEAASIDFWEQLKEEEAINFERVMTLNKLIGETDDSTKIQKTWKLMEDPYFQKALLNSFQYLSDEQKKFIQPIVEIAKLNAERVILWPQVERELSTQSEEVRQAIVSLQSKIDSVNRRVVAIGDATVSGTLAHAIVRVKEAEMDYQKSIRFAELKTEAARSEFLEAYEKARTFKAMTKARMNFLLGIGKDTEWRPWESYKESLFPGGFQAYIRGGGFGMDLPRIVGLPIYNVAKYGWKAIWKTTEMGLSAVQTGITVGLDVLSSLYQDTIETLGDMYGMERKDIKELSSIDDYPFKSDNFVSKLWNLAAFNVFNLPDASLIDRIKDIPVGERFNPKNLVKWVDFKKGGYISEVFASQYHPRAYEEKLIAVSSKPLDHLPEEYMGVKEEFLQLNGLTEDSNLKMGDRILVPTEAFVASRNLLAPEVVKEIEKTLAGRLSLLAFDFLGFVKLDPLTVYWTRIASGSKSLMKMTFPKVMSQLKHRKDLLGLSKQYSRASDFMEDMADFASGDAVAEGVLQKFIPGIIKMRGSVTSVKVIDNLDPRILNEINKIAQKGELWRSGFYSKIFLENVKRKVSKENFKVFQEGIEGLMLEGKMPGASENVVWEVLNEFGGDGFKLIQKLIKGTPDTFAAELAKLVKTYHQAEGRAYYLRKNLDAALKGLTSAERNVVLNLSQKTPNQIKLALSRLKQLGRGITLDGKFLQRAEFNPKAVKKIATAISETKQNYLEMEKVLVESKTIISLPDGSKLALSLKKGGENYYDPFKKINVVQQLGNMGTHGFVASLYTQAGKQVTKFMSQSKAYFSEGTLIKRYYMSYDDIMSEIKNGNFGFAHRLTDTLIKFKGEEIKLSRFLKQAKLFEEKARAKGLVIPYAKGSELFKESLYLVDNLPNKNAYAPQKWHFDIPVTTKESSSLIEAILKHIKFDILIEKKWKGMSGSDFRTMLENIAKIDKSFVPVTIEKTIYTSLPFQYGQNNKALQGYINAGGMPSNKAMQKILKEESKKILKVIDPKDFKAYFEEAMSLYFMKKYDPSAYVKYKRDILQMFETQTAVLLNEYLTSHQRIALIIFRNENKGVQSLPPSIMNLLEGFTGDSKSIKTSISSFLEKRIMNEKAQIVRAEEARIIKDFRAAKIKDPESEWKLYKKRWSLDINVNPNKEEFSALYSLLKHNAVLSYKKISQLIPQKILVRLEKNYSIFRGRGIAERAEFFDPLKQTARDKLAQVLSKKIPKEKRVALIEDLTKINEKIKSETFTYLPSNDRSKIDKEVEEIILEIISRKKINAHFVIPESHKLSKYAYNRMKEFLPSGKVSLLKRHGKGKDRFAISEAKASYVLKQLGLLDDYTYMGAIADKDIFSFWSRVDDYVKRFKYQFRKAVAEDYTSTETAKTVSSKISSAWVPDLRTGKDDFRSKILPYFKNNGTGKMMKEYISSPIGAEEDISISVIAQFVEQMSEKKRILNRIFDSKSFYIQTTKKGKRFINFKGAGKLEDLDVDSILYFSNGKVVGNIPSSIRKKVEDFIYNFKYLDRIEHAEWPKNFNLGTIKQSLNSAFNLSKYSDRDQFAKVFKKVLESKGKDSSAINRLVRRMDLEKQIAVSKLEREFYPIISDLKEASQRGDFLSYLRSEIPDIQTSLKNFKTFLKKLKRSKKKGDKYIYLGKKPSIEKIGGDSLGIMEGYKDEIARTSYAKKTRTIEGREFEAALEIKATLLEEGIDSLKDYSFSFTSSKYILKEKKGIPMREIDKQIKILTKNVDEVAEYLERVEGMNKVFSVFDFSSIKIRNIDDFIDAIWDISKDIPSEKALSLIGDWRGDFIKRAKGASRMEFKSFDLEKVSLVKASIKPLPTKTVTKFIELFEDARPNFIMTDRGTDVSLKALKELKADLIILVDLKIDKGILSKLRRKAVVDSSKFFPVKSLMATKEEVALARRVRDAFYKNQRVIFIGEKAKKVKDRVIDLFPPMEAEAYTSLYYLDRISDYSKKPILGPTYLRQKGKTPIEAGMSREAKKIYSKTIPTKSFMEWDKFRKQPSVPRLVEEIPNQRTVRIVDEALEKLEHSIEKSPEFRDFWINKVKIVIGKNVKQVKVTLPEMLTFNDIESLGLLNEAGIKLYVARLGEKTLSPFQKIIFDQLKKEGIYLKIISIEDAKKIRHSYSEELKGVGEIFERLNFFKRKVHSEIKSDLRTFFKDYKKVIPFSSVSMGDLQKSTYEWLVSSYKMQGRKALIKEWKETAAKMRKTYEVRLRAVIIKEFGTFNNKTARHIFARKLSKFDELIKMAEELKLGFGSPTRIGITSLISKLRAGLSVAFNWVVNRAEGPLSLGEEGMLLTIKGIDNSIKFTGGVLKIPFRVYRTLWIWGVLFLRPAWHLNNQIGDTLRGTIATKQLRYMMDSYRTFGLISASYLSFLGRDVRALVWPLYRYFLPTKVRRYIRFTDPLVKTKTQILKQLNLTLKPNTAKNTYALKKILSQYEVTFNPKTIRLMHTKGPQGWTSKRLFKEMTTPQYWQRTHKIPMITVDQSTHMGLLTAAEDPILGAKMWKLMKETGILSALARRGALMKLDLILFANINEKMRRLLLLDNLMRTQAMSLARASMKVRSYLFDYSHLSRAETTFRLIIPFWSFTRFSFELYSKMLLKQGPKFYWAGQLFIKSLEEAAAGLPEQFKNRVKIPFTNSFAYIPIGIADYFSFMINPRDELMRFLDNPQQLPFGLGYDPGLALLLKNLTGKKWYQTSRILKDHTGWTDEEIKAEMERDGAPNVNMTIDFPTMFSSFIPIMDLAGVIFPSLFKIDQATMEDELSLIGSKPIRSLFKFFGFNIMKVEPWMEFSVIYDRTAPHLRPFLIDLTKKESPAIYKAWENMIAKSHMIKMLNAKTEDEKILAAHDLEKFIVVSKYYELEERQKGLGDRWIEDQARKGNLTPKALIQEHWKFDIADSSYRREQKAKFEKLKVKRLLKEAQKKYAHEELSPTKEAILDILNIPHPDEGFLEVFKEEVFDGFGNPRFDTIQQGIEKLHELKERFSVPNLVPEEIRKRLDKEASDWKIRSWESHMLERIDDEKYFAEMAVAFSYIPANIDSLSEEAQTAAWDKNKAYLAKMSDEHQKRYREANPEYVIKAGEYLDIYIEAIRSPYKLSKADPLNKNYYVEFLKLPGWIKSVYFINHPEKVNVIPFKAKLFELFQEDRTQHLKGYSSNLREDYYFSNDSLAIKARQDMDAEELAFQKLKVELSKKVDKSYKSGSLVGYYTLFIMMPQTWQDRYWELKENSIETGWMKQEDYDLSKTWFEFNSNLEKARIQDNQNLKVGIFSDLEEGVWNTSKWNKVKSWYERQNEMNDGYSEYSKLKFKFNQDTKEGPQNYYKFIKELPEKAKWYYYRHHLDSIKYIDFMSKYTELLVNEEKGIASDFFWSEVNKIAREAFFLTHPNEKYYIEYRDRIFALAKDAGEYYDLILSAPQKFQDIYFRKHPLARLYLREVQKYFKAITLDTENKTKGIKSQEAKEVFESKSFQKALKLWDKADKGVFTYYTGWYEISKEVDKKGVEKWGEIYTKYLDSHPGFKEQLQKRQPDKFNILYPFKIKLWKLEGDEIQKFFLAPENYKARELMEKEDPGITAYYKFWYVLSGMANKGHWTRYFVYYFSDANKESRLRHWAKNSEAEDVYPMWRIYQLRPAGNWEERRAKTKYLNDHPRLKTFFSKGTEGTEVKLRADIDEYFEIKNDYPDEGEGYSFFLKWKIQDVKAEKFLEDHIEIAEYFQRFPKKYGDEQSGYMQDLVNEYNLLPAIDKNAFIKAHPPLFDFLIRFSPPGVRKAIKLQKEYFELVSDDWDAKNAFLKEHPILKEYWEVNTYPKVFLLDLSKLKLYKDIDKKILEYYTIIKTNEWSSGERLRQLLPEFYANPGSDEIGEWFKNRIYREAMSAWADLLGRNQLGGIAFFRALPEWLRNRYLSKHPEYNLITQYPLERFAEEPLRRDLLSKAALRLHLAERMHYKYSPNLPWKVKERIKKEFIRAGVWESRASWKKSDWQRYYLKKAIKKNNLFELDLHRNALLRKEFEKLSKLWLTRGRILPFKRRIVPIEVELID